VDTWLSEKDKVVHENSFFLIGMEDITESIAVKALAVITILVTLICVADLLMKGQPTP